MAWYLYILLVIIIVAALVFYFYPVKNVVSSTFGPYNLSSSTAIFDNKSVQLFETSPSVTLQGFFYFVPMQRTPTAMTCNTPGNPSCEDGRFHTCYCGTTNDCSNCKRTGYYPLLQIGDTCFLEILPAPDSGRQGKALTQLSVITKTSTLTHPVAAPVAAPAARPAASSASVSAASVSAASSSASAAAPIPVPVAVPAPQPQQAMFSAAKSPPLVNMNSQFTKTDGFADISETYVEFLTLPPIPLQKWVMVTIVKEGRRFDIYYDNHLVLSQKTENNLSTTTSQTGIKCGNTGFSGYGGVFTLTPSALSGTTIAASYKQLSDTRGAPYITLPESTEVAPTKLFSLCPSGGCIQAPTIRPAKPWLDWDTAYA
jgi:hypothetical protein